MKRGIKSGNITPHSSLLKFSDEALDEQKHAIRIADEKVSLATQAYDLVKMEGLIVLGWKVRHLCCCFIIPEH
ncbi:hypothetical protein F511_26592 [Dorcoceras hygrometricum]|uniref:Inhibitor of growth protein N-terminal histone-binding domain-containing protein n=1 Tax=Dorcoceras hygrometricum TaxID=472368 RepID=A0A2Z7AGF3_9LAMI|nr:hypothetical protein F511_26592 [Dorcoceras hygrometricum]